MRENHCKAQEIEQGDKPKKINCGAVDVSHASIAADRSVSSAFRLSTSVPSKSKIISFTLFPVEIGARNKLHGVPRPS